MARPIVSQRGLTHILSSVLSLETYPAIVDYQKRTKIWEAIIDLESRGYILSTRFQVRQSSP